METKRKHVKQSAQWKIVYFLFFCFNQAFNYCSFFLFFSATFSVSLLWCLLCHCKFIVCDFFRVTAVSVCFDVLFAVFLALFPQAEKRRERERESLPIYCWKSERPVTTTTLPALSGKEAHLWLIIIFLKNQHVIRIEKKNWLHMSAIAAAEQLFKKKTGVETQPLASRSGELPTTVRRS